MKSRGEQGRLSNRVERLKSRNAMRTHLVLDFQEVPTEETSKLLADRGMRVVAFLPNTGVIVGFEGEARLEGLSLNGFDSLMPADKLSPELDRAATGAGRQSARVRSPREQAFYVIEFHGDVSWDERRALVNEAGLEIRDHRDLVREHMLVRGTWEQVRQLADWDEVAYIFPASGELATGQPLIGCMGAAAPAGQVGSLTARIGEGWDGEGKGSVELSYSFQALTQKIPSDQVREEILRAMAAWSRAAAVKFTRGNDASAPKNINILFGSRDHGDRYAFDGQGKVLAHTYYPSLPNPEPIAGDLHFDDDELWKVGDDVDLYSVALHELGHALGLGHSDVPNAVMYAYYRRASELTPEDIGAIQQMYAEGTDVAAPAPPKPIELAIVTPANGTQSTSATVLVTGTMSGAVLPAELRWTVTAGETGTGTLVAAAVGGYAWQILEIPVQAGENRITVTITDADGRKATRQVTVNRLVPPTDSEPSTPPPATPSNPAPNEPAGPESTPLTLAVSSPAVFTTVSTVSIAATGTVAGGSGSPTIRWANARGFQGTAVVTARTDGGFQWIITPISLLPGSNAVTITATDAAGDTSTQVIQVDYVMSMDLDPDDRSGPAISITSPNTTFLMTQQYSLSVRGTASDTAGVTLVRWECSCGKSGVAEGTVRWTIPNVTLPEGTHKIKVIATDALGNENSATLQVFRY